MTTLGATPLPTAIFELCVVSVNDHGSLLRASGELDLAAAQSLGDFLECELSQGRRFVRLDVSRVTFLDSQCLAALVRAHQAFLAVHGLLILLGVDEHLEHLLKITHLDLAFFYLSSQEDRSMART